MGKELPGAGQHTDAETAEIDHSHPYTAMPGLLFHFGGRLERQMFPVFLSDDEQGPRVFGGSNSYSCYNAPTREQQPALYKNGVRHC